MLSLDPRVTLLVFFFPFLFVACFNCLLSCFVAFDCFVFSRIPEVRFRLGLPSRGVHFCAAAQSASAHSTEPSPAGSSCLTREGHAVRQHYALGSPSSRYFIIYGNRMLPERTLGDNPGGI